MVINHKFNKASQEHEQLTVTGRLPSTDSGVRNSWLELGKCSTYLLWLKQHLMLITTMFTLLLNLMTFSARNLDWAEWGQLISAP